MNWLVLIVRTLVEDIVFLLGKIVGLIFRGKYFKSVQILYFLVFFTVYRDIFMNE